MVMLPRNAPATSFGVGARTRLDGPPPVGHCREETPGPGHYRWVASAEAGLLRQQRTAFFGTGRQREAPSGEWTSSPGPGSYTVGARPPQGVPSIRPRTELTERPAVPGPGPGQYSSPRQPDGPEYTIGVPQRPMWNELPGPGHYTPRVPQTARVRRGFGCTRRTILGTTTSPGPGEYDSHAASFSGSRGPKYTMSPRLQSTWMRDAAEGSPGPGRHDVYDPWGRQDSFSCPRLVPPSPAAAGHRLRGASALAPRAGA